MSLARRRKMVNREHPSLSMARQCVLLGVSRSGLYYRSKGPSEEDLAFDASHGPAVPEYTLLRV